MSHPLILMIFFRFGHPFVTVTTLHRASVDSLTAERTNSHILLMRHNSYSREQSRLAPCFATLSQVGRWRLMNHLSNIVRMCERILPCLVTIGTHRSRLRYHDF